MGKGCKILSIDAWRDPDGGWFWNSWYDTGITYYLEDGETTRSILKNLRDYGLLTEQSKGRVSIEDDGYNLVIVEKNTREPLFAIEHGEYF